MPRRREVIATRLAVLNAELRDLEVEDHKLRIAECDHVWRDESYENGHNGDWEETYFCPDCQLRVYQDPRA